MTDTGDTVGRNFVESRVTFSRSTVRIQPGECHDMTQSYVRQYEYKNYSHQYDTVVND